MRFVIELSKYLMLLLVGAFTYHTFRASLKSNKKTHDKSLRWMTILLFLFHSTGYFIMYIQTRSSKLLLLYGAEVLVFTIVLVFYKLIYPNISKLLLINMLMLLSIGYVILCRLSFDKAVRQFIISAVALGLGILLPLIIEKYRRIRKYGWIYGILGIALLVLVLLIGDESYGATSWLTIFGLFTFQPTEFVKLLFILCIAAFFSYGTDIKRICIVTAIAGVTVLSLVLQKDLGGALIFFVTYIFMLYAATGKPLYLLFGLVGGSVASWVAYSLFDHVKVRVMAWRNPFGYIDKEGYQISQSLFAIGTGGWFGMGLLQGLPTTIPVVDSDFIFSAIAEEFGGLFSLCLILLYINCFLVLIRVSIKTSDRFYRLLSLGFSVMFSFQVFLSIGGVIKLIPSTGVTLPFISSGGSSIMATIIMFMIIQGVHNESNNKTSIKADIYSGGDKNDE